MIAAELNLEVPTIDFNQIELFLVETLVEHSLNTNSSREEKVYELRNRRSYPWQRRILEFQGKPCHDYRNKNPFKILNGLLDNLPVDPTDRTILMIYQKQQPDYDFNYHYDGDREYGFRVCFNLDTDKVFVEFAKLREEYSYVRESREKILDNMIDSTHVYQLKPIKTNTVFCFNRLQYPHRVPLSSHDNRLVLIVQGTLQKQKFEKMTYSQIIRP